ncbi:MAG: hypothetical protein P1P90_01875 [Patescibacteria group bacterium]|nr:hypothetical protein [Patescibacteria group bacterium]
MRIELVYKAIPVPEPVFIAEMMQMPDPKPEDEEKILTALPKLQTFFIKKREAYRKRDLTAFQRVLDEEIKFLQDLDEMALHY